ncbi:MAG: hypothetical protein NUV53_04250 [Patescibacteria group bacterium]|nr:hypothetical protein [Patescibacteria group bacterium]
MTFRTRTLLFYGFCAAFAIIGTIAVLYAQGWRVNTNPWSIGKVGGIFIKSQPRDITITLDGESVTNTSWLLQNGTFINNLFPKTYLLTLEKNGFSLWSRHVVVAPSFVTELSNVVLVPTTPILDDSSSTKKLISNEISPFPTLVASSSRWRAQGTNTTSTISISSLTGTHTTSSFTLSPESTPLHLAWNNKDILTILETNGILSTYNPTTQILEKIADDVVNFSWNAESTKIAAMENRSLEIFDIIHQREGYHRFNLPRVKQIKKIVWYRDNLHIFIVYPGETMFLGLDDSNLENIPIVAKTDQVTYEPEENILYYEEGGATHVLQFPR